MNYPKITIGLVLHKGLKYLKHSLGSLAEQDYPNIEFLIRDQSPHHEAYDFIKKELPDLYDRLPIEKGENLYHSGGHNTLIRKMTGEYYFCVSQDMWYPPHFVEHMVKELEKHEYKKYGSATCKLMVWDFDPSASSGWQKTSIIDSCGLGIRHNHHFYDVGQGENDKGQYDHKRNIFGASGALAVYRKEALEDAAWKKEYFDEYLHYKDDIDLAYRLQWAGWPCLFIPEIKVYHDRLATNLEKSRFGLLRILKGRKSKSRWVKENSFFGQQVVLIKNFSNSFSKWVRLRTLAHQWGLLLFSLVFEPYQMKQVRKIAKLKNRIIEKKKGMKVKVKAKEIEKFMT